MAATGPETVQPREVALDAVSLFDHLKHEMDYLEWSLEPGYTCGSANAPNREGKPQHASVDVSEEMGFEPNRIIRGCLGVDLNR